MVKVDLLGFDNMANAIKMATVEMQNEVNHEVVNAGDEFAKRAKKDAPKDQSQIAGSIGNLAMGDFKTEVFVGAAHAVFMEFGTKGNYKAIPGVDPSQYKGAKGEGGIDQFFLNILDWVKRKGLADTFSTGIKKRKGGADLFGNVYEATGKKGRRKRATEKEAYDLAFVIMLSILKKGVKPQPFFFKQSEPVKQKLLQRLSRVLKSVKNKLE